MSKKPIIALTMGDPFGIGPELACKCAASPKVREACSMFVIGSEAPLRKALEGIGSPQTIRRITDPAECVQAGPDEICLIDMPYDFQFKRGEVLAVNGQAAIDYMTKAHELIMAGAADGTAGAPCHKAAMKAAGSPYAGATEFFGHLAGDVSVSGVTMLGDVCSFSVTNHLPLLEALKSLNYDMIEEKIADVHRVMRMLGYSEPRIAIAGINPHAGDGGALGREEIDFEIPAIEAARKTGIRVDGPIPTDFLHIKAQQGLYDAIISIFHDTKSIGNKLLAFTLNIPTAVVTVGLPYVRSSVAHGTAYDIAYQNIADYAQMEHSICTAARLAYGMRKG